MRQLVVVAILAAFLLSSCVAPREELPSWQIAGQGEACIAGHVIDKTWNVRIEYEEINRFYILIEAEDGQIGYSKVTAYQYESLEVDDAVCVVR